MTGIVGKVGLMLACLVLAGCGGEETPADVATPEPPATSSASTPSGEPTVEPVTMVVACPEVEAVLPRGMIPGFGKQSAYVDRLNELDEAGDTETQNALGLLIPEATELMLAVARNARGSELTDPLSAHLEALSAFATRCKAAGSSALQ